MFQNEVPHQPCRWSLRQSAVALPYCSSLTCMSCRLDPSLAVFHTVHAITDWSATQTTWRGCSRKKKAKEICLSGCGTTTLRTSAGTLALWTTTRTMGGESTHESEDGLGVERETERREGTTRGRRWQTARRHPHKQRRRRRQRARDR